MKTVLQRVSNASVSVDKRVIGNITQGIVIFVGFTHSDTEQIVKKRVKKILECRIFNDSNHKMNLSIQKVEGEILLVSQFTLYADCKKGNRPNFIQAATPDKAKSLYNMMIKEFENQYKSIQTGKFGAMMEISLINDGPVTIIMEE